MAVEEMFELLDGYFGDCFLGVGVVRIVLVVVGVMFYGGIWDKTCLIHRSLVL